MSDTTAEPKTHCAKCGVEMLAATAERTGGICMPCKNGAPPEWARRQLWRKHGMDPLADIPWHRSPWGNEILTICRKLVAGEIGCVEGSLRMVELSGTVLDAAHGDKWLHKDWEVFFAVTGAAEALQRKGEEFSAVENTYSKSVRSAAAKLLKDAEESNTDDSAT